MSGRRITLWDHRSRSTGAAKDAAPAQHMLSADAYGLGAVAGPLTDPFGRQVTYLRLSVTDRCDLRCTYCMAEDATFVPRKHMLSLEESYRLASMFIANGVRKVRITGGEPLVRKNIMSLFGSLSVHLESGELDELTLTTNGTQLARYATELAGCGVRRVNVSLDTLCPQRYEDITRRGKLAKVLEGINAAQHAGLEVKLNAVASRGAFEDEVDDLIRFAHGRDMDLTLIEEMPLGELSGQRSDTHLPLNELKQDLSKRWTLTKDAHSTGGPARFTRVSETGGRLGFITPLSCDFCGDCNRVRVSCTGQLYTCMGDMRSVDLKAPLRASEGPDGLMARVREAVACKPKGHAFDITKDRVAGITRSMSVLGG